MTSPSTATTHVGLLQSQQFVSSFNGPQKTTTIDYNADKNVDVQCSTTVPEQSICVPLDNYSDYVDNGFIPKFSGTRPSRTEQYDAELVHATGVALAQTRYTEFRSALVKNKIVPVEHDGAYGALYQYTTAAGAIRYLNLSTDGSPKEAQHVTAMRISDSHPGTTGNTYTFTQTSLIKPIRTKLDRLLTQATDCKIGKTKTPFEPPPWQLDPWSNPCP